MVFSRSTFEIHAWPRCRNFLASFGFVTAAFLVYRFSPHTEELRLFTNPSLGWSGAEFLSGIYVAYSLLLLLLYLAENQPGVSKSVEAIRALRTLATHPQETIKTGLPREQRLGLLSVLLKGFFAPIMLLSLFQFTSVMIANGSYLLHHAPTAQGDFLRLFNSHGFWFTFQAILFLDVFFYTIGYLIEHPRLKNEIRSVDPTWLGWGVALACYPPFNQYTARLLGGNIADFPQFEDVTLHLTVNVLLLMLMAVYASASIALNLKASNLTHRGIICRGPYRYVRHPAYAAKNMAWWLGSLPVILIAWEKSAWNFLLALSCVVAWTALYVLRALTEEAHLRKVDAEYDAYCQKVRNRFIPGLF